nr:6564_t:CDS:2 [Entrophospora candida]
MDLQAQIVIDPNGMILRMLYYKPQAYYKTLEKVANACRESVFNFQYTDICEWLSNQALYQIYPPRSGYIPRPSYNNVKKPNSLHSDDLFYMPWGKIKGFSSGPGRRILAKRPFRGQHSNELAISNFSEARVKDNTILLDNTLFIHSLSDNSELQLSIFFRMEDLGAVPCNKKEYTFE